MKFIFSFRQEYTIQTSKMTAQLTRYLNKKSGPITQLAREEIIPGIAASNISQSKPIFVNTAKKIRSKAHECKHCCQLFDQLAAYKEHERTHTGKKLYTCKHCKSALPSHHIASDMNEPIQV